MSKMQEKLSKVLKDLDIDYIENYRPDWMQTENGGRLELDFYIPNLQLAIEVQGIQHFVYTPFFHNTYKDFEDQIKRDESKRVFCNYQNIKLLEIFDNNDIEELISYLKNISKKASINWGDIVKELSIQTYNYNVLSINISKEIPGFKYAIISCIKEIKRCKKESTNASENISKKTPQTLKRNLAAAEIKILALMEFYKNRYLNKI